MSAKPAPFPEKIEPEHLQELQGAVDQFALTAVLHPAGAFLGTNEKYLRIAGYRREEVQRKPFQSFLSEDFRRFFIEHVLPLLNRGISWRGEICHVARNQELFWTEATLVPIMDSDRSVQKLYFVGFEVTERKAVEKALTSNTAFFTRLMEIAPIGFFMADAAGRCTYINKIWSETSGCRLRQALGHGWLEAVHPDDRAWVNEAWQAFIHKGQAFNCEYRYQHASGRTVWVMATAEPVDFALNARTRSMRVEKDLTERKESERLINEQRAQMMAASKMSALGEMAGGMAHEINNPLAILQLRAQQIIKLVTPESPHAGRLLHAAENIRQTTDRIARVIRSLRSIAREGRHDPFMATPLGSLIDETLELCRARFQSQDITLNVAPYPGESSVWCRTVEVLQILLNLLNNAFSGAIDTDEKWVDISFQDDGRHLEIRVTDSGRGIASDIQSKIFQPFFTTKPIGSGAGLGLSTSKAMALDHGGDLWLDTAHPHTRFILRIPKFPSDSL